MGRTVAVEVDCRDNGQLQSDAAIGEELTEPLARRSDCRPLDTDVGKPSSLLEGVILVSSAGELDVEEIDPLLVELKPSIVLRGDLSWPVSLLPLAGVGDSVPYRLRDDETDIV